MCLPPCGCLASQYQHLGGLLLLLCFFPLFTLITWCFAKPCLVVNPTTMAGRWTTPCLVNWFLLTCSSFRSSSSHWVRTYCISTYSTGLTQHSSPILLHNAVRLSYRRDFSK
ncbi:hypothetical protein PMIN01_04609 [Paraphaeosphaeria minitans]|uniref:Uncharacterized protein n=1 Tax=Paraphaeosphaeria minitans TaxID=565426 RepID=A0A9P6GKU0_9PLEO|nr:hypothetical protein PMIN01_04609 [Paraphaeosphaeria minitans]